MKLLLPAQFSGSTRRSERKSSWRFFLNFSKARKERFYLKCSSLVRYVLRLLLFRTNFNKINLYQTIFWKFFIVNIVKRNWMKSTLFSFIVFMKEAKFYVNKVYFEKWRSLSLLFFGYNEWSRIFCCVFLFTYFTELLP